VACSTKKNPYVAYADVAAAAKAKGHKVYPIVFGRAKLLLGLVKAKPAKKAKAAAKKAAKAAAKTAAAGGARRQWRGSAWARAATEAEGRGVQRRRRVRRARQGPRARRATSCGRRSRSCGACFPATECRYFERDSPAAGQVDPRGFAGLGREVAANIMRRRRHASSWLASPDCGSDHGDRAHHRAATSAAGVERRP
jgi:hypothetical protein